MRLQTFHDAQKLLFGIALTNILLIAPAMAAVQTITYGKDLLMSCQQALNILDQEPDPLAGVDENDAFLCMAYLGGMMATAQHANERAKLAYSLATDGRGDQRNFNLYCFNWQLPYKTIARIVLDFGRNQPMYLPQPAHKLAIRALQAAFPCR